MLKHNFKLSLREPSNSNMLIGLPAALYISLQQLKNSSNSSSFIDYFNMYSSTCDYMGNVNINRYLKINPRSEAVSLSRYKARLWMKQFEYMQVTNYLSNNKSWKSETH